MIIFSPIQPWSAIAVTAAGLAVLLLLGRGGWDYFRGNPLWHTLGRRLRIRLGVLCLSIVAALLLALAAMNPIFIGNDDSSSLHLQVVVDVSDSIMRADGGWPSVHRRCQKQLFSDIQNISPEIHDRGTAGILTFRGSTASAVDQIALKDLPEAFGNLDTDVFATGDGTNIEAGLDRAGELLAHAGGRGVVLLVSDGNQTDGNAMEAAKRLARLGIPIYVRPITSRGPALAVTAADLPRQTHANVKTFVRGVMFNRKKADTNAALTLSRNPGIDGSNSQFGDPLSRENTFLIPGGQWARLRWPIFFQGCGIQFVDLSLSAKDGKEPHKRRFFTHVNRPPKILALGGDNSWVAAIPKDKAEIIQMAPKDLVSSALQNIDALVIGSTPAFMLEKQSLTAVAEAVKQNGMGLMLINGGHQGADYENETVLMSYNNTPLEELLPVKSGPRAFTPDPPPRNVVILIDTSGSMSGHGLTLAKQITRHIVLDLLRDIDRLDLITFTTGAGHLLKDELMDEKGKKKAIEKLDQIFAGGGTDPNRALSLVGNRKFKSCGLIFISDGHFGQISYRPDCRATAFAIGRSSIPKNSPLWKLADPIPILYTFDPKSIIIPYFDPNPRQKFFEAGVFTPLSMEMHLPKKQRLPVPSLPLNGSAVSCLKDEAILNGVRPKLTDPVLAYNKAGMGYVGVFTTEFTAGWFKRETGRKAIEAWITAVVPYMARQRYDFKLHELGNALDLSISLNAAEGIVPRVHRLEADIRFPGGSPVGISLRPDELSPGVFHGQIRVKRGRNARQGILTLSESGPDALGRSQQVPILVPPRGEVRSAPSAEEYSFGRNRVLLESIASVGGGMFDPPEGVSFFRSIQGDGLHRSLWMWFLLAAIISYLSAIALRRLAGN